MTRFNLKAHIVFVTIVSVGCVSPVKRADSVVILDNINALSGKGEPLLPIIDYLKNKEIPCYDDKANGELVFVIHDIRSEWFVEESERVKIRYDKDFKVEFVQRERLLTGP